MVFASQFIAEYIAIDALGTFDWNVVVEQGSSTLSKSAGGNDKMALPIGRMSRSASELFWSVQSWVTLSQGKTRVEVVVVRAR